MKILLNCPVELLNHNHAKYSGGIQQFSKIFLEEAKRSKHEYIVVVFEKKHKNPKKFKYRIVKRGNITWVIINAWVPTLNIISLYSQTANKTTTAIYSKIKDLFTKLNPDVFLLNGIVALHYLFFRSAHDLKIPIVSIHHGLWYKELEYVAKYLSRKSVIARRGLEKDLAKYSKKNIFISKISLDEYQKNLKKIPPSQIEIIPIPFNKVFLNAGRKNPAKHRALKVGMVARWDKIKNHEAYLNLVKLAKSKNIRLEFYSVTTILKNYPPYFNLWKDYQRNIKVLEPMEPQNLRKFYQSMDVIVLSSWFETFSGVVMEGLLQNKPVLISKNTAWTQLYKKFKLDSWILDFNNAPQVLNEVQKSAFEPPPKELLKYIKRRFNQKTVFNRYIKVLKSVTN